MPTADSGRADRRSVAWRHASALILLSLLTFFAGLGRAAITESDEAFYAEAAREMVESGDWVTPYFNYEYRFQKPILYYWLAAATYRVVGVGAMGARLPSALAGLGLVLLTWSCARRWYGEATGLLAGAIVATSFGYFVMARLALPDLTLALFVTLTTWAAMVATLDAPSRGRARGWLLAAACAAALGVLTKGPLGILLPALVVVPVMWLERRDAGWCGRTRGADWMLAAVVFVALAAPWYVAMYLRHGQPYLEGFFIGDNLERFTAPDRFNERRSVLYYLPIIGGGLLPWSTLLLLGVGPLIDGVRRRTVSVIGRRLLLWTVLPLMFFSASQGKQPRYILPLLPPLAILLARAIDAHRLAHPDGGRLIRVCAVVTGVAMLTLAILVARAQPLFDAQASASGAAAALVTIAALGVMASAFRWPQRLPAAMAIAGAATLMALQFGVLSSGGTEAVERMAERVTHPDQAARYWASFDVFGRNLVFYARERQVSLSSEQAVVEFLSLPDRVLLVIPADTLARIERQYGVRARRLAVERHFDPSGMKLRTLLWPDPEHDVEHVLLVTNQ